MRNDNKKYSKIAVIVIASVLIVCSFLMIYRNYLGSDYNEDVPVASPEAEVQRPDTSATVEDPTGKLDSQQIRLLKSYAQRYADTLAYMKPQDISSLYTDTESEGYNLNKAALDVITTIRDMRDIDLTLESAEVNYTVENVEIKKESVTVHLLESNTQKFQHLSQPSYSANLYHKFILVQTDSGWKISQHYHEEDFYLLAMEGWADAQGADNTEKSENAVAIIVADAKDNLSDQAQFQQGTYHIDLKVADTSYNRQRAVEYAQQWWNERNYDGGYLAYDEFGGNCQNFASQCIHAGGIDMDHSGNIAEQWKFYNEILNSRQTATGRSYSWTGVDMFYAYAISSYKSGLVSLTDIEHKYAEKGDIIHVGAYNQWRHALLIIDVLEYEDGTLQDIIVASNTADRWNYPLSAYIYTAPRLIHILGQN